MQNLSGAGSGSALPFLASLPRRERAGEAQLVTVRVADMEAPFTPRCVRRWGFRSKPGRERAFVHRIHVVDPQHDATPDGPLGRAGSVELQVQVADSNPEGREDPSFPPESTWKPSA